MSPTVISHSFLRRGGLRPPKVYGNGRTQSAPTTNISNLIKGFKATATKQNNQHKQTQGMPVWQRGYYHRIIRNEEALLEIQQYIFNNPAQWASDENNIPQLNG
ncbi:MAG: transposase [Vampirovibrio sp.]|nr:transposase [Vampirovibrio sp.]